MFICTCVYSTNVMSTEFYTYICKTMMIHARTKNTSLPFNKCFIGWKAGQIWCKIRRFCGNILHKTSVKRSKQNDMVTNLIFCCRHCRCWRGGQTREGHRSLGARPERCSDNFSQSPRTLFAGSRRSTAGLPASTGSRSGWRFS